jgi:competence ComEA-like helix-hairpin-helix protein
MKSAASRSLGSWLRVVFFHLPLLTSHAVVVHSAFEEKPPSARAAGMSEAMTAVSGDANSLYYNPAGLRFSRHAEVMTGHTRLFGEAELPYQYFGAAVPTRRAGVWGVSYGQFGPAVYREQELAVTHSVFFNPKASFGYSIKRSALEQKRYGDASALGLDVGFLGQLHPKVKGGIAFRNVNQPRFGSSPEGPAQELRAGLAAKLLPGFLTAFDVVKPADAELAYRIGEEVQLAPALSLRFGVQTRPNRYSAGVGLRVRIFRLDYAFLSHPYLHEQHHATFSVWWGPEDEVQVAESEGRRKSTKKKAGKLTDPAEGLVNINTATVEELTRLPGVGRTTAQNVVDYRKEHGPYKNELELLNVPRFLRRIFLRVRPFITVSEDGAPPSAFEALPPAEEDFGDEPLPADEAPAAADEDESAGAAAPVVPPPAAAAPAEPAPAPPGPAAEEPPPEESDEAPAPLPALPLPTPVVPAAPPAPPPPVAPPPPTAPSAPAATESAAPTGGLDVNAASADALERLGFTSGQARNIVRYRQRRGRFATVDDLQNVPGVSRRALETLRRRLAVR